MRFRAMTAAGLTFLAGTNLAAESAPSVPGGNVALEQLVDRKVEERFKAEGERLRQEMRQEIRREIAEMIVRARKGGTGRRQYLPMLSAIVWNERVSGAVKIMVGKRRFAGPCARAGIRTGDRLEKLAGHDLRDAAMLKDFLRHFSPGDHVVFGVRRGNDLLEIPVELGEIRPARALGDFFFRQLQQPARGEIDPATPPPVAPGSDALGQIGAPSATSSASPSGPSLGVTVKELSLSARQQAGLGEAEGLLVVEVILGSLAAISGLAQWDILLAVDGAPVNDPKAVAQVVRGLLSTGRAFDLGILRGKDRRVVRVVPPAPASGG